MNKIEPYIKEIHNVKDVTQEYSKYAGWKNSAKPIVKVDMNKYVVAIYHYFSGYQNFTVEAVNKTDALEKAKEEARRYGSGNYNINDSKVVKKLKK